MWYLRNLVLCAFACTLAMAGNEEKKVCDKTNRENSASQNRVIRFFEPPMILEDIRHPFPDGALVSLTRAITNRFPEFRGSTRAEEQQHVKDDAVNLAQNRRAFSINGPGGTQYRLDPVKNHFEMIDYLGRIVLFWPLGDKPSHKFFDNQAFLARAAEGHLRAGFGIPEPLISPLSQTSLPTHQYKHRNEDPAWATKEGYLADAYKLAASDDASILVARQNNENGEHLLKFDPATDKYLVMKWIRREERWSIISLYKLKPTIHGKPSNMEFFLSQIEP